MGITNLSYVPRTCSKIFRGSSITSDYARTFSIILVSLILFYILFFAPLKCPNETMGQQLHGTTLSQQDSGALQSENPYKRHMEAVKNGCGDICKIDMEGSPSLFHDYIEKEVDCLSLLSNPAIDATMTDVNPPTLIPEEMLDAFTYHGQVPVRPYSGGILNQRYLGKEVRLSCNLAHLYNTRINTHIDT